MQAEGRAGGVAVEEPAALGWMYSCTAVLVRHGQTEANRDKIIQGQTESPLTELGEQQATQVGAALRHIPWTRAYASDLSRAFRTAEIILSCQQQQQQQQQLPVTAVPDERLRERALGVREGLSNTLSVEECIQIHAQRLGVPPETLTHGLEPMRQLQKRARSFFMDLTEDLYHHDVENGRPAIATNLSASDLDHIPHDQRRYVLIVSHGGFLHTTITQVLRVRHVQKLANCSITEMDILHSHCPLDRPTYFSRPPRGALTRPGAEREQQQEELVVSEGKEARTEAGPDFGKEGDEEEQKRQRFLEGGPCRSLKRVLVVDIWDTHSANDQGATEEDEGEEEEEEAEAEEETEAEEEKETNAFVAINAQQQAAAAERHQQDTEEHAKVAGAEPSAAAAAVTVAAEDREDADIVGDEDDDDHHQEEQAAKASDADRLAGASTETGPKQRKKRKRKPTKRLAVAVHPHRIGDVTHLT